MTSLAEELASLPRELRDDLKRNGFDPALFQRLASSIGSDPDTRNRLPDGVSPPAEGDIQDLPPAGTPAFERLHGLGMEALEAGALAFVVLAGGMATRMGGIVKALVAAVGPHTFLDLRLNENRAWAERAGRPVPLWMMTSFATDAALREAVGSDLEADRVATFMQNISLRLERDGSLFREADGSPCIYAPGHGDLPDALRRSGLLDRFIDGGGRYLWLANIDNLGATVDPVILGWHIDHRAPVSVEVVDKVGTDKGGIPVRWKGRPVVMEEFRLPRAFDPTVVRVFNTNTFIVDARAVRNLAMEFTWVEVIKNVGDRKAIQFERLVGEMTTHLDARFVRVPRAGAASRFLPVKDHDELARRRDEIQAVASSRGMLP